MTYLTFNELQVGEAFRFAGMTPEAALPRAGRITRFVKLGPHEYAVQWADGEVTEGRVGVGDNPVVRLR